MQVCTSDDLYSLYIFPYVPLCLVHVFKSELTELELGSFIKAVYFENFIVNIFTM